jgi:putative endonuclease
MPHLYILECADGSYYTGSTWEIERRLAEHEQGLAANFTRKHLPVKLVFAEEFDSMDDAFRREKQVQGWSRAKKRALIEGRMDDLPALARKRSVRGSS